MDVLKVENFWHFIYKKILESWYKQVSEIRRITMVFLQEVAPDDNHNRIGDVLRVRRKEKRYIESVNPPLDPFETIRLWFLVPLYLSD